MSRIVTSVTVSLRKLRFGPGIHILWGQNGEDIVLGLAGIFGGKIPISIRAEILWCEGITLGVFCRDGACFVDKVEVIHGDPAQLAKAFHKHRLLNFHNRKHILDGADLPAGFSGASELLMEKLRTALTGTDRRPLFVCNLLERLDEAIDLRPIFHRLSATGRQVFIALPHSYPMKTLEEIPYGTTIHTL